MPVFKKLFITAICIVSGLMALVSAHAAGTREVNISIESNVDGAPFKIRGLPYEVDGELKREVYYTGKLPFSGTLQLPNEELMLYVSDIHSFPEEVIIFDEGEEKLLEGVTDFKVKLRVVDAHKAIADEFESFPKDVRKALLKVIMLYDLVYSPSSVSEVVFDERAQRAQVEYKMLLIDYPEFEESTTNSLVKSMQMLVILAKYKYVEKQDIIDVPAMNSVIKKALGLS